LREARLKGTHPLKRKKFIIYNNGGHDNEQTFARRHGGSYIRQLA
jgi:hypothetical protein